MTDEQMDARLRAAGLAFRGEDASTAVVDHPDGTPDVTAALPSRRRRPIALLLSAAVVVAALVVGGLFALRGLGDDGGHDHGATGPTPGSHLVNRTWTLDPSTRDSTGGTAARPDGRVTLRLSRDNFVLRLNCGELTGGVEISTQRLVFGHSSFDRDGTCLAQVGTDATSDQLQAALYSRYFDGAIAWSVDRGRLLLTKAQFTSSTATTSLVFDGPGIDRGSAPSPEPSVGARLFGTTWTLTGYERSTANTSEGHSARGSSISFTAGKYTLEQACNGYSGTARLDGQHLVLGAPVLTDPHSCPAGAGDPTTDDLVRTLLRGSVAWSINAGTLTLTSGNVALTFDGRAPSSAAPADVALVGTSWLLDGIDQGSTITALSVVGDGIRLVIGADGVVTAGVCSSLRGAATPSAATVVFSGVRATTPHACTGGAATDQVTQAVTEVLTGSVRWSVSGKRLVLTKGGTSLSFTAR